MSKRITLTNDDLELILRFLNRINPVKPYNDTEVMALQRKQQLLAKLKIEPSISKVSASSINPSISPNPK